jgi:hypothetical protein
MSRAERKRRRARAALAKDSAERLTTRLPVGTLTYDTISATVWMTNKDGEQVLVTECALRDLNYKLNPKT